MRFSNAKQIKKFVLGLAFYSGAGLCLIMGLGLCLLKPPSDMAGYHVQAAQNFQNQREEHFLKDDSVLVMATQEQDLLITALSHTPDEPSLWVDLTKAFVKTNQIDRAFGAYKMAKSLGIDSEFLEIAFRVDNKTVRVSSLSNPND